MAVLDDIRSLAKGDYNGYLDAAVKDGRKVIGYFCSYVPEEIIHAAGFVPYRMRAVGSAGTSMGDAYYSSINCTFVRHCFDKALRGNFHFLDGIVFMNGCDHVRRMYDNWRHADLAPAFRHMFVTPHVVNDTARERYLFEMGKFKDALETHFSVKITDEALASSILLYNKKRSLLLRLYDARKQAVIPVRGSELLDIMLAVTMMPVEDAVAMLEDIVGETGGRAASSPGDIRIFLASGCVEESSHLELIESCGGAIVADSICLGARHADTLVEEEGDPMAAIAKRYVGHLSCPRMMDDFRRRLDSMHRSREEYDADAVIAEKLKFCDLWGGEIYLMRQESKKYGFPILALERELYGSGEGQLRTRIQAFFEQVRNRGGVKNQ